LTTASQSSSELRYRRLFEAAHDGILIVDPDTRKIVDVNHFMEDFLGYTRDEFIGKELFEIGLLKDEEANQAAFRELRMTGYIRYEDLPLQAKSGQCLAVEFVSNIYEEGDHAIIQCNIRDITARKKTEKALHEAKEQLTRYSADLENVVKLRTTELRVSNSQLETFVYSIAHDLRAPLQTMQGFSQLLVAEHGAALDEQGRIYANYINKAAQEMDHLLRDLLDFSRINQQKVELMPVALDAAVQKVVSSCEKEIQERHAWIETIPPWAVVSAHPSTLQQVLVNLVTNALKFVSGKTPHVRLWCEERLAGVIRIWVEDNGIGIRPEFHERVFQVFQRLHTTQYEATGKARAIAKKGVKRRGGRGGVESTHGQGSRFWIELSKEPAASPRAPKKEKRPC
jgi:PAS domain S-box-containing protein